MVPPKGNGADFDFINLNKPVHAVNEFRGFGILMFSAEMAIFVEGTRLAQDYAVSPTFLIPAFVILKKNPYSSQT